MTISLKNGLQLSDFSITTDPKKDFPNATFRKSISNTNAFVFHKNGKPDYGGEIFINAKGPLYKGASQRGGFDGGTKSDWILLGASILRHEQWHRDAPTHQQRISEKLAYKAQFPVFQAFRNSFSSKSFYTKQSNKITQRMR